MDEQLSALIPARRCNSDCWTDCLAIPRNWHENSNQIVIGVLPGEGVGAEVIDCAVKVITASLSSNSIVPVFEYGDCIGRDSEENYGKPLSENVIKFCKSVFDRGGAILNGPGGGRYVYDLRREFDLFFKISPLQSENAFFDSSPIKPDLLSELDILVLRENSGGIYQGKWELPSADNPSATHHFEYTVEQVERFLESSAKLAKQRRGDMTIVWKESGIPGISQLWRDCAEQVAARLDVRYEMGDVDLMAYRLISEPQAFDILVTPNLFGDVLGDLGAVLLGSRGNSFSGNFNSHGYAVYQTNHGAAYDLAGTNRANPIGQIFSASMMLRESFGLFEQAIAIENAVRDVWREGWRTADISTPGGRTTGTREMGDLIARRVAERNESLKSVA